MKPERFPLRVVRRYPFRSGYTVTVWVDRSALPADVSAFVVLCLDSLDRVEKGEDVQTPAPARRRTSRPPFVWGSHG